MEETGQDHQQAMRYALSLPGVSIAVVGMYTEKEVVENAEYARSFEFMSESERLSTESIGLDLAEEWKDHFGPAA
jgi:predicted aldo/keto reductase-like oxidoreductase